LEKVKAVKDRSYRVGVFLSDLQGKASHGISSPTLFMKYLNKQRYDAFFLKYLEIHGCGVNPHLFEEGLRGDVYFLPWSVDCEKHTWKRKKVDVTFIGNVGSTYPLRQEMWEDLYYVARGYKIVREMRPPGKTFDRKICESSSKYVGDDYCKLLNETRIMIFGCSKYRYPLQKYFESAASGCLILADEPSTAKRLGFVDNKTYVDVNVYDWRPVLQWCLENEDKTRGIVRSSLKNVLMNHSHEKRADEFLEMIG